jgi:hypothetical protein
MRNSSCFLSTTMILFVVVFSAMLSAQNLTPDNPMVLRRGLIQNTSSVPDYDRPTRSSGPRGYAHYTAKDWRRLIDSTWGPGLPTNQKLQIFDDFWNNVNQLYAGFPNLGVNWDSMKNVYRPEVAQGVSRGRFAAIMSYMSLSLRQYPTYIADLGIDSAFLKAGVWQPLPSPPCLILSPLFWSGGMGATLTPLPDSTLLVLSVVPNQPLGLQAGDIVLGYDRVPWKQLIRQLLEAQLPFDPPGVSYWCSTPEGWSYTLLASAAANWPLFDSLDVVKYSTGETVHLPTSKMAIVPDGESHTIEQLPVKGVAMVDPAKFPYCTWGIIEGTKVGYIYIYDWGTTTAPLVSAAIDNLMNKSKTEGLIVDLRVNSGAGDCSATTCLGGLFSFDPFASFSDASRTSSSDKMGFTLNAFPISIPAKHQIYDRPIAVLTAPKCCSDVAALLLRSHPMVRFFGKPTNSGYLDRTWSTGYYSGKTWYYQISTGGIYSNYPGEGYLMHKGFDVDERISFTKDDAAKGDDTIVKRALQWIAELAHGHDVTLAKNAGKPTKDSIKVTATVENPQKHTLSVWSYLSDRAGVTVDSCQMYDDGLHNDGAVGDKVYGGSMRPPTKETTLDISLRTIDITAGTSRRLPRTSAYFTNGPVVSKGWRSSNSDTIPNPGDVLRLRFPLANNGTTDTVRSVTATVSTLDTMVFIGTTVQISYGDLAPGVESAGSATQALRIQSYCPPNTKARLLVSIVTEGVIAWTDTVAILVQASATEVADNSVAPTEYSLSQNYPNPFNPSTTISYSVPTAGRVSLSIFNTLGQEVALLTNDHKGAGTHSARWDATNVPSGIYFYRLQAGQFVETKKMILLR